MPILKMLTAAAMLIYRDLHEDPGVTKEADLMVSGAGR